MTMIKFANNGDVLREAFIPKNFSTIVDTFFNEAVRNTGSNTAFRPAADILERENSYEIQVTLPGLKKEDISLELKENKLVLKGERKNESEEKEPRYFVKESYHGSFSRSFRLPENANREGISAEFRDGILYINVSKLDPKEGITSIEIK